MLKKAFFLVCFGLLTSFAGAEIQWEPVSPYPNLGTINSVAFGAGKFVAAGSDTLAISEDLGSTWERLNVPTQNYSAVLYTNSQFVAVGTPSLIYSNGEFVPVSPGNKVVVSVDGRIWLSSTITNSPGLLTLSYVKGRYVATGVNGFIATSTNAQDWTVVTSEATGNLAIAASNEDKLIVVESSRLLMITTNGVDWTRQGPNLPNPSPGCRPPFCLSWGPIMGLAQFNGQFVMQALTMNADLSDKVHTLVSANGLDWTEARAPKEPYFAGGNTLFAVNDRLLEQTSPQSPGSAPQPAYTTNLTEWLPFSLKGGRPAEGEPFISDADFGNGTYVIVGPEMVARGPSLEQLERVDSPVKGASLGSVAAHESLILATGFMDGAPVLVLSTNSGRRFDPAPLPAGSGALQEVEFAQDKFVAVGAGGTVIRTTNGADVSRRLSNTSADLTGVTYGNGLWVAVGANGTLITSPDASVFTLKNSGTAITLNGVTFGGGTFVAVGQAGLILTSTNAENWTAQATDDAQELFDVAYGNGRFVATGTNGIVQVSTNGVNWTATTLPDVKALESVAFAHGFFFAVDTRFDRTTPFVYVSEDGATWTTVPFPQHTHFVDDSDGTVWVTGGTGAAYIAKAAFSQANQPALTARLEENGNVTLSFTAAVAADYEILSADALAPGDWQSRTVLPNVSGTVTWTDPAPAVNKRFYILVQR